MNYYPPKGTSSPPAENYLTILNFIILCMFYFTVTIITDKLQKTMKINKRGKYLLTSIRQKVSHNNKIAWHPTKAFLCFLIAQSYWRQLSFGKATSLFLHIRFCSFVFFLHQNKRKMTRQFIKSSQALRNDGL